jgi:hypothetical protein
MASSLHQEWRNNYEKSKGVGTPRMKSYNGRPEENINVPFEELSEDAKKDNMEAAKAAYEAVTQYSDREKGSSYIHDKWLERNGSWAPDHQKVSYEELNEEEKDKDRLHYDMMKQYLDRVGGRRRRRSMKKRRHSNKKRRHSHKKRSHRRKRH